MQSGPFSSVLASASGSQLQREATCSGRRFNCRHDFAEWPPQVASPFRQPCVNSVSGSALISIPGERSISKGSPTQFPSLRYVSLLDRGAARHGTTETQPKRKRFEHRHLLWATIANEITPLNRAALSFRQLSFLQHRGGEGTRTLDLRLAKPPLFQLSYTPGETETTRTSRPLFGATIVGPNMRG